ncbi:16S rRNA (guanine(527)-N(7))-methyltransferase RsmG [Geofilum rubicundum]|uniref:Ribosomal RNA small subunit methyltransferase G n=1 Tax=Geofilum rubicundum JCM 15548 TaxID=1236989 RepID=A0A0E9LTP3_9BACT|nr:16S rRNA (guanine(527)-N(7))-methyltransferase RsmG [Geofilum rubicundum]GAO28230.1 rRNA small subunit methyltransferase, glucose inhibited division protein GidB [Geofilum rubicundum JCM 15548]
MNPVYKYFKALTPDQIKKIDLLQAVYAEWNERINVISRKDMDAFYEHHVLHALSIAKFITFEPGSRIIDVGTGGGFPGIPLAILFPKAEFTLIDSIGKKIKVVSAVTEALQLSNVKAQNTRSEQHKGQYDFIISRAVTTLPLFVNQTRHLIAPQPKNAIGNGILYLKGGDLTAEIQPFKKRVFVAQLSDYFEEPFFETKKLVHLTL